jgi:hypothetical protein
MLIDAKKTPQIWGVFYFFIVMLRYCAIVISRDLDSGCRATKAINVTAKINTIAKMKVVSRKKVAAIVFLEGASCGFRA